MESQPFVVDVPQPILDDLQERLARTRGPDEVEDAGWDYGTNLAYVQALVAYWRTRFDWREQERAALPHFRAAVTSATDFPTPLQWSIDYHPSDQAIQALRHEL